MSPAQESELMEFKSVPVLPLRDIVVYPSGVHPLFVGTEKSIRALEAAMEDQKQVLLVAKRDAAKDDPGQQDLFAVGTISTVLQLLNLQDGAVKVLVEGEHRVRIVRCMSDADYMRADVQGIADEIPDSFDEEFVLRSTMQLLKRYASVSGQISDKTMGSLTGIEDLGRLIYAIATQLQLPIESRQSILETSNLGERAELLMVALNSELEFFKTDRKIRGRIKKQLERSQREYFLNEQMKAIQKELGDTDNTPSDMAELEKRINKLKMPKEAKEKATSEISKLKMMPPMSAEATVVRGYLDWMLNVPWGTRSRVRHDLAIADKVLNEDHHGLEDVKDRILEFLAVQQRVKKLKGPVLCLVGPPGVGKTSLGESIARATNRKFVRMALGGIRDEAEIRGHRRTYIGAMPGKVLQKMSKAGVCNPLFLLDEVDKMGMDVRGDPASALLEVLDPEQNNTFNDHYLEVDYDLSHVLFIATSNSMNIPPPLLDRMEIIHLPGYTEDEKIAIGKRYLLPKQERNCGLAKKEIEVPEETMRHLIRHYTREAGVRGLERELARLCRKVVREHVLSGSKETVHVDIDKTAHYSGVQKYDYGRAGEKDQVGSVVGLAWTQLGGELLDIEAAVVPGRGRQTRTGSLGDVMQESIQAAITVVRDRAHVLGIPADFHQQYDLHVHVPEGATPKDGPSAGIGMCTALVSALTEIPVRAGVAMTGEITLHGQVLPIGGLKQKLLAAHRGGISTVVIPEKNRRDLQEIPDNLLQDLEFRFVQHMDEVLEIALCQMPQPADDPAATGDDVHNAPEGVSVCELSQGLDDASVGKPDTENTRPSAH